MHIVVEFLEAERGQEAALRQALLFLARTTLDARRGCQQFDIGQDDLDGTTFLLYQVYVDKEAHTQHLELTEYANHRILTDPWIKTRRVLTYHLVSHGGTA